MADHQISLSLREYPNGKIRSIIADGTHWITVAEGNVSASVAVRQARHELLDTLRERVEELDSPRQIDVDATGAVVSVPVDRLVWRSDIIALLEELDLT